MKFLIVTILVSSLLLCCGAAWHGMVFGTNMSIEAHAACDMGNMGDYANMDHTSVILSLLSDVLQNFSLGLFVIVLSVIAVVMLSGQRLIYYFKYTRDRYGGFLSFVHTITLFRLGILHPRSF